MISNGGLDFWIRHVLAHPRKQVAQPVRHDLQRVQHQGIVPSKAQFADPDLIIQLPAMLLGLPAIHRRETGESGPCLILLQWLY